MKNCFIYCRQSSGSGDAGTSLSIQQQLANCLKAAEKMDLEVSDVFTDANISGKTYPCGKYFEETAAADKGFQTWFAQQTGSKKFRRGLGSMMERLKEVSFIIVDEITRLHRAASNSFLEQVMTFEITAANVKIIQVKGGTLDLKSFDQNLIHLLKTRINDEQIANQKRKSIESRQKLKDSGIFCNVKFYGAVYDGNKKFHFDPRQSEVVKYVFEQFTQGVPVCRIVNDVNKIFPECFNKAKCFYASTLKHIAAQPLYAGLMYDTRGKLIKCCNAPPPLIREEQFFKAGELLAERKYHVSKPRDNEKHAPLIFSGFLRCANCGSNLLAVYDRDRIVYKCRNGEQKDKILCRECRILISGGVSDNWGLMNALAPLLVIAFIRQTKLLQLSRCSPAALEQMKIKEHTLKDKIKVAFELFEEDVLDEENYKNSVRNCMSKIHKVKQEQLEIENLRFTGPGILRLCGRWDENIRRIEKQISISNSEYREMLAQSVRHISVAGKEICIFSEAGMFYLPRIPRDHRQTRVIPPSLLKRKNVNGKEQFEVIFSCGNNCCVKKTLLKWENLTISIS